MPKGRISTRGFSDIINDYTNEEKLKQLYAFLYISEGIGFEALQTWRKVDDPNIKLRRKKPMKFTIGLVTDADAYDAETHLLKYTKPEMVEEYYSLDQRLEVGRQYSTLDINSPEFMDSEMVEVTEIEKQLKREAIAKELQLNANKYQVDLDADAYDIWETIFNGARKTGMNTKKLILIVRDSLLLRWRRTKLFEHSTLTDVVLTKIEDNPLKLDNAFKDDVSGVTFIAIPDVYEAIAKDGTVREVKLFNDDVQGFFYEDSTTIRVLDCVYMEHTPLRIGKAAPGMGYGNVDFMEKISYYGCNLLEPKKAGQITTPAAQVETATTTAKIDDETKTLQVEVKTLKDELKTSAAKSSKEIADLTQKLAEAEELLKEFDKNQEKPEEAK
ncbi:hypothetical protein LD119_00708 [Mesoplasma sp. JKS002660]|uniref:hypothetical protein n=1 Tax=Mesoplasma whartonense TaxID=2878854 RepID=UPI002022B31F|nr:hypothetical protein [Mesoplasma sp. JKS002660]MCL8213757.1 hypothetical protein [Mesoplasma sp. JKS002660]